MLPQQQNLQQQQHVGCALSFLLYPNANPKPLEQTAAVHPRLLYLLLNFLCYLSNSSPVSSTLQVYLHKLP